MRLHPPAALLAVVLVASACQDGGTATLDTDDAKASYGIGYNVGRSLVPVGERLDMDAFLQGVEDVLQEREPAMNEDSLQMVMQRFSQSVMEQQRQAQAQQGEENRQASETFLAENAEKEGVTVTASGVQYEVLEEGSGPTPAAEDRVRIHYTGTLPDGTEFDTSRDGEPAVFQVGGVIRGFAEALQLMPVGSRYRIVIPSDLAYGPGGGGPGGPIGPNQALVFDVELLEIVE